MVVPGGAFVFSNGYFDGGMTIQIVKMFSDGVELFSYVFDRGASVQLSAPILGRFVFVVLDECDNVGLKRREAHNHRCSPCCDTSVCADVEPHEESRRVLVDCYRKLRQGDTMGRSRTANRITVRQLESLIRPSEALTGLHCDDFVRPSYVREAFRLWAFAEEHHSCRDRRRDIR